MYSSAINHYRTHLSNDKDYYKVIDDLSYDDDWGVGFLDPALYNTDPRIFDYATGNNFEVGGKYMDIYSRRSNVKTYKAELTSQINAAHQLKGGLEYRKTDITYNSLSVLQSSWTDYDPVVLEPEDNTIHNSFQSMEDPFTGDPLNGRTPVEFSTYLQDKIESDDIVVNIGARYDYFDSQFWVLNDSEDPNYMSPVKPINRWNDTDPTTTNMILGSETSVNNTSMIGYCFAEVPGFSRFGRFRGNGSVDGSFVFTGFRPAFLIIKKYSGAGDGWYLVDNKSNPSNRVHKNLFVDTSGALSTAGTAASDKNMDFLSNGFKVRTTNGEVNQSNEQYVYMAFAEFPFVSSNSKPGVAKSTASKLSIRTSSSEDNFSVEYCCACCNCFAVRF